MLTHGFQIKEDKSIMKLKDTILTPDPLREPFFDGDDLESGSYAFECSNCDNSITINCFSIYTGAYSGPDDFSDKAVIEIENFFSFNSKSNISISGGWPSITKHFCSQCGLPYIVIADFSEYRNSVYKITMQGIARCW